VTAIGPVTAVIGSLTPLTPLTAQSATGSVGGASFGELVGQAIEHTQQVQTRADELAVKAATGDLADAHEYLAASAEASLTTQLTVAVRNKAIEAFQEIMRLQA
jgi:flagellar hook-basal body complex protein FliE